MRTKPRPAAGWLFFFSFLALAAFPANAQAQLRAPTAADTEPIRFRVGAIVTAKRGACRDIRAMVAVPIECAEQTVKLLEEDFTSHVAEVKFRELAGGNARQMLVSIPFLGDGEEARAVLTYEVATRTSAPLPEAEQASLVAPKRPPRNLRGYVGPSPFIESKHPRVRKLARQVQADLERSAGGEAPNDWSRVEALYDHVLETIEYAEQDDTSAVTTLQEQSADCHGRSALFVALCRSIGVPARMVWVHNHCYPEFYLERPDGQGLWLPAESAGTRAFGEMPLARTILQKGDDFRVPERKRERLRYASDYLVGRPTPGAGKPSVRYLREVVP